MGRFHVFASFAALLITLLWGADRYLQSVLQMGPYENFIWVGALILSLALFLTAISQEPTELHRVPLIFWVTATIVLGGGIGYWIYDPKNTIPLVGLAAAILATIGWLVQRDASMFLNRKQHTLNILLQMRQSEAFTKHRTNLFAHYPYETNVPATDVAELYNQRKDKSRYGLKDGKEEKFPVIESIQFIANFYEFLAAAIRQNDLDEQLLYDTLGSIMLVYYEKILPVLHHHQKPDSDGTPTTDIFTEYYWLYHRWKHRT